MRDLGPSRQEDEEGIPLFGLDDTGFPSRQSSRDAGNDDSGISIFENDTFTTLADSGEFIIDPSDQTQRMSLDDNEGTSISIFEDSGIFEPNSFDQEPEKQAKPSLIEEEAKEDLFYSYITGEPPAPSLQKEVVAEIAAAVAHIKEESRFQAMSDRLLYYTWEKNSSFEASGLGKVPELLNLMKSVTDSEGALTRKEVLHEFAARYEKILDSAQKHTPQAMFNVASRLGFEMTRPSLPMRALARILEKLKIPLKKESLDPVAQLYKFIEKSGKEHETLLKGYVAIRVFEELDEYLKKHD